MAPNPNEKDFSINYHFLISQRNLNEIRFYLTFNPLQAIRQRAKKQRSAKKNASAIGSATSSGTVAVVIENIAQTKRLTETAIVEDKATNTASGSNEDEDDEK